MVTAAEEEYGTSLRIVLEVNFLHDVNASVSQISVDTRVNLKAVYFLSRVVIKCEFA